MNDLGNLKISDLRQMEWEQLMRLYTQCQIVINLIEMVMDEHGQAFSTALKQLRPPTDD